MYSTMAARRGKLVASTVTTSFTRCAWKLVWLGVLNFSRATTR